MTLNNIKKFITVGLAGLAPAPHTGLVSKTSASSNSATVRINESVVGFEPTIRVLQTRALNHLAIHSGGAIGFEPTTF